MSEFLFCHIPRGSLSKPPSTVRRKINAKVNGISKQLDFHLSAYDDELVYNGLKKLQDDIKKEPKFIGLRLFVITFFVITFAHKKMRETKTASSDELIGAAICQRR